MNRTLLVVAFASFASSLFVRMTDPLVPQIASEFGRDPGLVALLGTAFAIPWALMQPILGPLGDLLGKTRVIIVCLAILAAGAAFAAVAPSFPALMAARVITGAAAGGVFPVSMAVYGDLVPVESRQVAMSRLLIASISGMFLGSGIAGLLADLVGWRGIFIVYGVSVAAAAGGTLLALRGVAAGKPRAVRLGAVVANFREVWANPRSKICYGAVFAEGLVLMGLFPFVAVLLVAIGETRTAIAGLVVSAFSGGGVIYALSAGVLVKNFRTAPLMRAGGLLAALGLLIEALLPPWPAQVAAFAVMGFGFFLLHACILVQMTELAPTARGTAVAGHAFFYYVGQAAGPVAYGVGLATIGAQPSILLAAAVITATGFLVPYLLFTRGREQEA